MMDETPDEKNESIRSRYIEIMKPLFFPPDPISHDIVRYFASLLRIIGMEDKGWDAYMESRSVVNDLYALMQLDLPKEKFEDSQLTIWRLGLLFYNHIVEMDAPYEVLTNLLRFQLKKGYSPNPYYAFLSENDRKRFKRSGLYPKQKIDIIKNLSNEANLQMGEIFDDFFRPELRNAISHSDFIFAEDGFRCRNGNWASGFKISFEELNDVLTKAKVFIGTYFGLELEARRFWGECAKKGFGYDLHYKGILEVLVDDEELLNGFKVHWPNGVDSIFRRTRNGIEMTNCLLDFKNAKIEMSVGSYARNPGAFSPLVEANGVPSYTTLEGSLDELKWSFGS